VKSAFHQVNATAVPEEKARRSRGEWGIAGNGWNRNRKSKRNDFLRLRTRFSQQRCLSVRVDSFCGTH
jgi:hypothetical protein